MLVFSKALPYTLCSSNPQLQFPFICQRPLFCILSWDLSWGPALKLSESKMKLISFPPKLQFFLHPLFWLILLLPFSHSNQSLGVILDFSFSSHPRQSSRFYRFSFLDISWHIYSSIFSPTALVWALLTSCLYSCMTTELLALSGPHWCRSALSKIQIFAKIQSPPLQFNLDTPPSSSHNTLHEHIPYCRAFVLSTNCYPVIPGLCNPQNLDPKMQRP